MWRSYVFLFLLRFYQARQRKQSSGIHLSMPGQLVSGCLRGYHPHRNLQIRSSGITDSDRAIFSPRYVRHFEIQTMQRMKRVVDRDS